MDFLVAMFRVDKNRYCAPRRSSAPHVVTLINLMNMMEKMKKKKLEHDFSSFDEHKLSTSILKYYLQHYDSMACMLLFSGISLRIGCLEPRKKCTRSSSSSSIFLMINFVWRFMKSSEPSSDKLKNCLAKTRSIHWNIRVLLHRAYCDEYCIKEPLYRLLKTSLNSIHFDRLQTIDVFLVRRKMRNMTNFRRR